MAIYSWLGLLIDYPDLFTEDVDRFVQDHATLIDADPEVKGALTDILGGLRRFAAALPKSLTLQADLIAQPMPSVLRTGATNRRLDEIHQLLTTGTSVSEVKGLVEQVLELVVAAKSPLPVEAGPSEAPDNKAVVQTVLGMVFNQPLGVLFTQALEHWQQLFTGHLSIARWVDWEYTAAAEHQISEFNLLQSLLTKKDRKRLNKLVVEIQEALVELRRRKMIHSQLQTPPGSQRPSQPAFVRQETPPPPAPEAVPAPPSSAPALAVSPPAPAAEAVEGDLAEKPRRESRHGQDKKEGRGPGETDDDGPPLKKRGRLQQEPPSIHVEAGQDDSDDAMSLGARASRKTNGKNGATDHPTAEIHPMSAAVSAWAAGSGSGGDDPESPT